jgi:hypothetical protein
VECDDAAAGADLATELARARAVARLIERIGAPVFVSDRERRRLSHRAAILFDVGRLTADERRIAWRTALGPSADADPEGVARRVVRETPAPPRRPRVKGVSDIAGWCPDEQGPREQGYSRAQRQPL